jgi:hypothetical protein
MFAILGLIPVKDWCYIAAISALLAGGVYLHHEIYESGVKAEVAKVEKQAAKETAALQVKATAAEHSHDAEIADLQAYRTAHPEQSVQLCLNTAAPVRPEISAESGASGAGSAASGIQQVPARDSGSGQGRAGPDIGGMLELLAARADQVSAQVREFQARE